MDHVARSSVAGTALTSAGICHIHTSIYSNQDSTLQYNIYMPLPLLCAVSEQLSAQHGAVKMLHSRVRLLLDYLKAVQSGKSSIT